MRRRLALAAAVLLAIVTGCTGAQGERAEPAEAPREPVPVREVEDASLPAPVPATAEPSSASAAQVLADASMLLARAVPHVEAVCSARFRRQPTVTLLSEDEAALPFIEDMRPEVERRYPAITEGQRETMLRGAAANAARSCVARYSVTAKTIVLVRSGFERQRAALDVPAERLLLASLCHETVHALDDERFDLAKTYRAATDDESIRARAMLVEGRATFFGRAAAARLDVPSGDDALFLPGGRRVQGERAWMLHMTYALGERFVAARGVEAADRAMAAPPDLTWHLCVPARWPDAKADPRPAEVFGSAGFDAPPKPLSDLQLRVRYTALDGEAEAEALLAGFRGGAQVFDGATNAAVLAFADEASAAAFAQRIVLLGSPFARDGTLVFRAEGADATAVLDRLRAAAKKR